MNTQSAEEREHGRFMISIDNEAGTAQLIMENVNRKDEHWLTLSHFNNAYIPIGCMRLCPIGSPDSHMFAIVELRPANGSPLPSHNEMPDSQVSAFQETE